MKKITMSYLILLFIALVISLHSNLYGLGMMGRGESTMHHYFMHVRNLKILEPSKAKEAMIHFTRSLNVKCNFCHNVSEKADDTYIIKDITIEGDFSQEYSPTITDEDLKKSLGHKNRTREMLKMVNYNNKNYLNWKHSSERSADQVNCWLCHRGKHDKMVSGHKKENPGFIELPFQMMYLKEFKIYE